jgi:hypothetical protein
VSGADGQSLGGVLAGGQEQPLLIIAIKI